MHYELIRKARRDKKMTQEQLADQIGVKRAVVSKYETGVIEPSISQLEKIATVLQVPMSSFLETAAELDTEITSRLIEAKKDLDVSKSAPSDFERRTAYFEALKKINETTPLIETWDSVHTQENNKKVADLVTAFEELNSAGKSIAIERVKELAKIPDYQRKQS